MWNGRYDVVLRAIRLSASGYVITESGLDDFDIAVKTMHIVVRLNLNASQVTIKRLLSAGIATDNKGFLGSDQLTFVKSQLRRLLRHIPGIELSS